MNILITGGSGFIGESIVLALLRLGHHLVLLSRNPKRLENKYGKAVRCYCWDALTGLPPQIAFEGVDAVINLMGEGVADKRWTKRQKQKIYESRVIGTQNLVEGINHYGDSVSTVVSTSAIGFYNHKQTDEITETSPPSKTFLSQVCRDWEVALNNLKSKNSIRTVIVRIGVVLGDGGALTKLITPFLYGFGGQIGTGRQWLNWIHLSDLTQLFVMAVENKSYSGIYNGVSPENVRNTLFTKTLAKVLNRTSFFRVPAFVLKILIGEMSDEILYGQRVHPRKLEEAGFLFQFKNLESALENALNIKFILHLNKKIRTHRLHSLQYSQTPSGQVFEFFSNAQNLEKITPPFLKFKVDSQSTNPLKKGSIISYTLRLRGFPIKWQSLICDWAPNTSFVDTQVKGPYKLWHHTHRFLCYKGGTFIEDDVYYALPNIFIISDIASIFVKKDIVKIFKFRKQAIQQHFEKAGIKQ
ncbi:TIGR01777 family protein [Candidatus Marinamargulisbacteria bacterium SCGC AAA071-K20]|nr:TIGR01777 family protein [Candidatus Marinamargulisbacteria bacterium SCGC AAA071-K20]